MEFIVSSYILLTILPKLTQLFNSLTVGCWTFQPRNSSTMNFSMPSFNPRGFKSSQAYKKFKVEKSGIEVEAFFIIHTQGNTKGAKKNWAQFQKIKGFENFIILKSVINKSRQKFHADKNVALPRMSFLFKTGNDTTRHIYIYLLGQ